jgi:hypothetical protein
MCLRGLLWFSLIEEIVLLLMRNRQGCVRMEAEDCLYCTGCGKFPPQQCSNAGARRWQDAFPDKPFFDRTNG